MPLGLNESTLAFYTWNGSQWVKLNSTVNTEENYVIVNISHFSYYAIAGERAQPSVTPIPTLIPELTPIGLLISMVGILLIILRKINRGG